MFREFELRAPLQRLEEALGEDEAAPAERVDEVRRGAGARGAAAEVGALEGELVGAAAAGGAAAAAPPDGPEEDARRREAVPRGHASRCAVRAPYGRRRRGAGGEAETLAAFAMARGERPSWRTTGRRSRWPTSPADAPPLAHDTMVAAYLIDPARRGYPLDELADRGRPRRAASTAPTGVAERAVLTRLLAERQRDRLEERRPHGPVPRDRAAAGRRAVEMERAGREARRRAAARDRRALQRARSPSSSARSGSWPARSSRSARRSSSAPILFEKLGLSRKRRGKTGFSTDARVLQAIRHEHEIVAGDRGVARAHEAQVDLPRRASPS